MWWQWGITGRQLVGFRSDGAYVMTGRLSGLGVHMKLLAAYSHSYALCGPSYCTCNERCNWTYLQNTLYQIFFSQWLGRRKNTGLWGNVMSRMLMLCIYDVSGLLCNFLFKPHLSLHPKWTICILNISAMQLRFYCCLMTVNTAVTKHIGPDGPGDMNADHVCPSFSASYFCSFPWPYCVIPSHA